MADAFSSRMRLGDIQRDRRSRESPVEWDPILEWDSGPLLKILHPCPTSFTGVSNLRYFVLLKATHAWLRAPNNVVHTCVDDDPTRGAIAETELLARSRCVSSFSITIRWSNWYHVRPTKPICRNFRGHDDGRRLVEQPKEGWGCPGCCILTVAFVAGLWR